MALAANEVARPTLYSLLVIIAAYVPIFALERVEGRIFAPMANTVVSALVGAMVLSFALVPVLTYFAFRRVGPPKPSPILLALERAYRATLNVALRHAGAVVALGLATLLAAGLLLGRIGSEFLPALNEGGLYITVTLPDNISLSEGRRMAPQLKAIVARTPEVGEIMTQLGRPEDGTDPTLPNNLEIFARLAKREAWRPQITTPDDIIAEISANLGEIPGIERNFSMPIRDNVNENVSGQFGQVALKIRGDDLGTLADAAERARVAINAVPGAADVGVVKSAASPALTIRIDREAIARFGVDLEDVQRTIATALGGSTVAALWEGERRFDITLRYPDAARRDAAAIRRLRIVTNNGALVPLAAVASVTLDGGRAAITRESGKRYVGVRMNVRGRDMGSFVAEARSRVHRALGDLPAGYELVWGGEFENQERAMKRLAMVVPIALVLTFLLLFGAFGRVGDAFIVLLQVPIALTGGVFGLALVGMPLSVSAAVGFIALLGQAVLNGVLVLAAVRARQQAGVTGIEAVREGAVDRLRAVVMTALLAALGLLPAAMSTAIGAETQQPIAVVIVAGTGSAAALTLIVLPATLVLLQRLQGVRARLLAPLRSKALRV